MAPTWLRPSGKAPRWRRDERRVRHPRGTCGRGRRGVGAPHESPGGRDRLPRRCARGSCVGRRHRRGGGFSARRAPRGGGWGGGGRRRRGGGGGGRGGRRPGAA